MAKYYEGSPQKHPSLGNGKLYKEADRGVYNQITGQESKSNPFVSNIGNNYEKHVQTT